MSESNSVPEKKPDTDHNFLKKYKFWIWGTIFIVSSVAVGIFRNTKFIKFWKPIAWEGGCFFVDKFLLLDGFLFAICLWLFWSFSDNKELKERTERKVELIMKKMTFLVVGLTTFISFLIIAPFQEHEKVIRNMENVSMTYSNEIDSLKIIIQNLKKQNSTNQSDLFFLNYFISNSPPNNMAEAWGEIYRKCQNSYLEEDYETSVSCYNICVSKARFSRQPPNFIETQLGPAYYFSLLKTNQLSRLENEPDQGAIDRFEGGLNDLTNAIGNAEKSGSLNNSLTSSSALNFTILRLGEIERKLEIITNDAPSEVQALPGFVNQIKLAVIASQARALAIEKSIAANK